MSIFSLADWNTDNQWGTGGSLEKYSENPNYLELKEAAAEAILDRAEKIIPGLRKSIKYKEIATPLTNWRYSLNRGGSIYGSEQTVDNMYAGRLNARTPIPNLFLAGAWAFGGGMSAALLSGRETSRMVLGHMDGTQVILMTVPEMAELPAAREPLPAFPQPASISAAPASTPAPALTAAAAAPAITLEAAGSGRAVTLNAIGRPAVLIFHGPDTAETAGSINQSIRSRQEYQNHASLLIANVVDLHSIPRLFRGIAGRSMRDSYEKAGAGLPHGEAPQDYVLILPDWDGRVTQALGLKDTGKTAGVAVLDAWGNVTGTYQGRDPEAQALALLQKIA